MQVKTCRIGNTLRLESHTRLVLHRRQGERICLEVKAPAGTALWLGGARIRPISGTVGVWTYFFSLLAPGRFTVGRSVVNLWLPGSLLPVAADCEDWLHVGIATQPDVLPAWAGRPAGVASGFDVESQTCANPLSTQRLPFGGRLQ
jgi:hypothetical protein